jgi:hypothetical protein
MKIKHGLYGTPIYTLWRKMKERCNNPNHVFYKYYGEAGIKVCDEWSNSFLAFYNWATVNGHKIGLEIDRIKNDGGYNPENCRFVTPKVNNRARSNVLRVLYNGRLISIAELADNVNIPLRLLRNRICFLKWSIERAVGQPKQTGH